MIKIVTDSACQMSPAQAKQHGIYVAPLMITINNHSYRDFEQITDIQLLRMIKNGAVPSTSQPSIGEKTEIYNQIIAEGNEVIDITMADGLSGTYQSALLAKDTCDDPDKVSVVNVQTLCVPQYVLVNQAQKMAASGASKDAILTMLEKSIPTSENFMIPVDFDFLVHGGRLSNASGILGGLLKLIPIIRANKTCTKLEKFAIVRTYTKALKMMLDTFEKDGVTNEYTFCLSHAHNEEWANKAIQLIQKRFENAKVVILPMSPAYICQGGPGCIAFQAIHIIND